MAFNVQFYQFSKKSNSTATPTGSGQTYACRANEPLDVLEPVIRIELAYTTQIPLSVYNYARIPLLERWYWITGWTMVDGLWEARLRADPLASWKTQIGSNSCYVYRSSNAYDRDVVDSYYPATSERHTADTVLPKPWTIGGSNTNNDPEGSGWFIVGIIAKNGTTYYAMSPAQFNDFLSVIFSDDFYDMVLGTFGAQEYPEAKVAVNPVQYISSVKFFPGSVYYSNKSWGMQWLDEVFGLNIGPISTGITTPMLSAYRLSTGTAPSANTISSIDIDLTTGYKHPQAAARGDWLNLAPYTSYELYYPPFGLIQLDPADISVATHLVINLSIDARTLVATLEVQAYSTAADRRTLVKVQGDVGVDVPVSNIIQPGVGTIQLLTSTIGGIAGGIAGIVSGNIAGGISSIVNSGMSAIGSAVHGQIPHLSTIGGNGSTANLSGSPRLYVTHWYLANDDNPGRGRPLMAVRQLSGIPGYIQADADELSLSCTATELAEIQSAVAAGFYYE